MHFIFISPERLQRRFAGGGCCIAAPDSRIKYATTPLTLLSASLILGAHFLELKHMHVAVLLLVPIVAPATPILVVVLQLLR